MSCRRCEAGAVETRGVAAILRARGTWNMLRPLVCRDGVHWWVLERERCTEICAGALEWWVRWTRMNGQDVLVMRDDEAREGSLRCEGSS